MITAKKIFLSTLIIATCLTGCSKKEKTEPKPAEIASVAEAQAVPMSAMPADEKTAPTIINDNTTPVELNDSNPTTANNNLSDNPENSDNTDNNDTDNSAMENISEDAEVIDNEPASPNAPKATEHNDTLNQKLK